MPVASPTVIEPMFSLDYKTGVFYSAVTGLPLSASEMRDGVDALIAGAKTEAAQLTATYVAERKNNPDNSLRVFEAAMLLLIAALHRAASLLAAGGIEGLARALQTDLDATVARERTYLAGFITLLRANVITAPVGPDETPQQVAQLSAEEVIARRAGSYMSSALMTYERQRLMLYKFLDFTEAARVLKPGAEHCTDGEHGGCEHLADLGYVPIEDLVPLGAEECGQWCECTVDYRRGSLHITEG